MNYLTQLKEEKLIKKMIQKKEQKL